MQQGSIIQTGRKQGPNVWLFRWSEKNRNGRRVYRKRVIGTVEQYPDGEAARVAAAALLTQLNANLGHDKGCKTTVVQICEHFEQKELRSGDSFRSFATVKTYRGYIRKWIKPRWGSFYLDEVKAVDVEAWLRRLPMARSSRAKIRNVLSILFNHACRYELFDRNPMRFVRQGAKRRSAPVVLTALEIRALVDHLALRERTLVLLAASTGLRQSELFGLKWRDVDFERGELSVTRSIVFGVVGRCKTESSQKPVPLHPQLRDTLVAWRKTCNFIGCEDWIFASRLHKGRRPYWGASILRKYVRPVAESLNIQKRIGWHTFRHTYSTLLRSVGAEFKVMQELMRHSTLRTTMDVYTQAVAPAKHAAQAAVLALFFPATRSEDDEVIIGTA
jgi:integrase